MAKKVIKAKLSAKKQSGAKAPQKNSKSNKAEEMSTDIIELILHDHKPLKELIETLKDDEVEFDEKKSAFEEFAPLLKAHADPEEKTWYVSMKEDDEMIVEGLEGDVEHGLADQLCEELKREEDEDMFMAKVKVLAELVEHHIEEEEDEMLPDYKKNSTKEERMELGARYLEFQEEMEAQGGEDAPREGSRKAKVAEERAQARR